LKDLRFASNSPRTDVDYGPPYRIRLLIVFKGFFHNKKPVSLYN